MQLGSSWVQPQQDSSPAAKRFAKPHCIAWSAPEHLKRCPCPWGPPALQRKLLSRCALFVLIL